MKPSCARLHATGTIRNAAIAAVFCCACLAGRLFAASTSLENESVRADFDDRGLVSLHDKSANRTLGLGHDSFSIAVDDGSISSESAPPTSENSNAQSRTFIYHTDRATVNVVYELRPGWRFLSKRLVLSGVALPEFHLGQVKVFGAKMPADVAGVEGFRSGVFIRCRSKPGADPDEGMFATIQNPYMERPIEADRLSLAYLADMGWKTAYGPFESDRVCIGVYPLTGVRYSRQSVPEWKYLPKRPQGGWLDSAELEAMTDCVRAFVLEPPTHSLRLNVGWCENDYQIDVSTAAGREEYKRIIEQAAALGCRHILFAPANSAVSSLDQNRDAWGWENVLWLGLGQQIRTGRWDPHKDALPDSVAQLQQYARSRGVQFLAYVYPSLPFMQDPSWTSWIKGRPGGYLGADTGLRSFQDWLIDNLVTFHDRTGISGFSFDHWFIAYDQPGTSGKYAQWYGCRRVLETLRRREPGIVIDGRQQYQQFGPWTWLAGSYPHPTSTDEQPQSFRAFPDLHIDRVSADRQRYAAWWYRVDQFCPPELMPGFITHQTPRIDAKNVMRRDRFRARDWDYLGWKYSLISSIATAPINHVVNMIPARDEAEFKAFAEADRQWFRSWLDWTDANADVLRNMRPILGQPMIGHADGSAACKGDRGFVFLFNPNYRATEARCRLDKSIGLSGGGRFILRQLYPDAQKGKLLASPNGGYWNYGDELAINLPGVDALVLEILPAPAAVSSPIVFGSTGVAAVAGDGVEVTGMTGEAGGHETINILLRDAKRVRSLRVNGMPVHFEQKDNEISATLAFAGDAMDRCPRIGHAEQATGEYHADATIPASVFEQLADRKQKWPIPYTADDLTATWLGPDRLLLFVNVADPQEKMAVELQIDGQPARLERAYSGIYPNEAQHTFVGWYADVSALAPGVPHHFDLKLPKLEPGQFQGLFLDNVEARYTEVLAEGAQALKTPAADATAQSTNFLDGVQSIAAPGLPGTVCAFGDRAMVIAAFLSEGSRGVRLPVVAGATHGTGHVVIFGHTGFLDPEALKAGDTRRLMDNLLDWAAPHQAAAGIRVGAAGNLKIATALESPNVRGQALGADWVKKLGDVDVLMIDAATLKPEEVQPLGDYVHRGGAVFMSETGWGWQQLHPGQSLRDHPANRLLAPMGLAFAGESARGAKDGTAKVDPAIDPLLHAAGALTFLAGATPHGGGKEATARQAQASETLLSASRVAPADSSLMVRLAELRRGARNIAPTQQSPLRTTNGLGRVLLDSQFEHWQDRPAEMQKAYAGADQFPGAIPAGVPRVTRTIEIDTAVPRWHSTGMYAAPGEIITVTAPADMTLTGLSVRIGAHTDVLPSTDNWARPPSISGSWAIKSPRIRVASPFGGLLYIDVARAAENHGIVNVKIEGAVEAPLFVLGKTSAGEWKDRIRLLPAPWAELASGKVILTCPSGVVRQLDDPDALMRHWDRVLDADATLVGRPLARSSPERIVADVQISAGYMHSGYPIMTHLDVTGAMVDLDKLHTIDGGWGFYHELGHNHQRSDWTFPGTTEVTVNLFSMYVLETVCGLSPADVTRRAVTDDGHPDRIKAYLAHPDFAVWSAEPFLALDMYAEIRLAFGWEPYKKVLAEYRDLPEDQRPRTPIGQHDQWMVRMSKAVGKNLGPFFQAWGVPTSDEARKSIDNLPAWMPDDFPR